MCSATKMNEMPSRQEKNESSKNVGKQIAGGEERLGTDFHYVVLVQTLVLWVFVISKSSVAQPNTTPRIQLTFGRCCRQGCLCDPPFWSKFVQHHGLGNLTEMKADVKVGTPCLI